MFPLEKEDYVRTRLTHSFEVSTFGRSIGISLEKKLIDKNYLSQSKAGLIPSLLATTGLIHDLGNPPFGHFGETAIQEFFKEFFKNFPKIKELDEAQINDFTQFDGNVQTFRVLKYLQYLKDEHGMNLTYATLATIVKYPYNSIDGNKGKECSKSELSKKKYGYFQSEKKVYAQIKDHFKLKKRFPFTFLLEAADDIAYSVADIEDACQKGIIDRHKIFNILNDVLKEAPEEEKAFIGKFNNQIETIDKKIKNQLELAVQQFRIEAQGFIIEAVIEEFVKNIDGIIEGSYDKDLLENSKAANLRKAFKKIAKEIFSNKAIIKNELIGYTVINYLLKEFVTAAIDGKENSEGEVERSEKNTRIFDLISKNYVFVYNEYSEKNIYNKIQLAVDYISGMTDSFALRLYKELNGQVT